jgi:hypothetical protein
MDGRARVEEDSIAKLQNANWQFEICILQFAIFPA